MRLRLEILVDQSNRKAYSFNSNRTILLIKWSFILLNVVIKYENKTCSSSSQMLLVYRLSLNAMWNTIRY